MDAIKPGKFFAHLGPSLIATVPLRTVAFTSFEYLNKKNTTWYHAFVNGFVAGATANIVTQPLDKFAKLWKHHDRASFERIWERHGFSGFYRNFLYYTAVKGLYFAVVFTLYTSIQRIY
jgi:hypothetical protein